MKKFNPTANPTPKLQGLGWMATRVDSGMFKDDRKRGHRTYYRGPIVAWLNCRDGQFSVNIVSKAFDLPRPIPTHITDLGEAVQWVYNNAIWR